MNPSESAIQDAIDQLKKSPGTFQRLVERFAELEFPDRFEHIIPKGRRPDDVSVLGWPDAYVLLPDGRIDALEATHSRRWRRHLEEDIRHAEELGQGRLAGFCYVAWARAPDVRVIEEYSDRFVSLGAPAERITFVFREQLVRALSQPRFASVWTDILGLRGDPYPFQLIRNAQIFGDPDRVDIFAPTLDEYLENRVHRPDLVDDVERRLEDQGWALVRGSGAAGKTVLAATIALGSKYGPNPGYYLDLGSLGTEGASATVGPALDAITTRADENVLFILDNVHLQEEFAHTVFDRWLASPNGSYLLMIGRWVSLGPDLLGRSRPLDDLGSNVLTLETGPNDMAGVFLRLASRFTSRATDPPQVPDEILSQWCDLFGGDLVAFSTAVARRMTELQEGQWQLEPDDSVEYVYERYLEPVGGEERSDLMRIAALARLELDAPAEVLQSRRLAHSLRSGLVHRRERGAAIHTRLHLVHPGMGPLLLAAGGALTDQLALLMDTAKMDPLLGYLISARLEATGGASEAGAILSKSAESPSTYFRAITERNLAYVTANVSRLDRHGVLSEEQADRHLAQLPDLAAAALRTPLHFLASFLEYAEERLPETYKATAEALSQPKNLSALRVAALRTPLHLLVPFLEYAEDRLPELHEVVGEVLAEPEHLSAAVLRTPLNFLASFLEYVEERLPETYKAAAEALSEPKNLSALGVAALRAPLGDVASFLRYAEGRFPEAYEAVSEALAEPEHLSAAALRTPLHFLASFLEYAEERLPETYKAAAEALSEPKNLSALGVAALRTPLGDVASFLRYAEGRFPEAYAVVSEALAESRNLGALQAVVLKTPLEQLASFESYASQGQPRLSKALKKVLEEPQTIAGLASLSCRSALDGLLNFLRNSQIAEAVIAAIKGDEWEKEQGRRQHRPNSLPALAMTFQRLGRPSLAEAPARALIRAADPRQWHISTIGLHHLTHTLRLGRAAGPDAISRFLDRIVLPDWLEAQYAAALPGTLAGALMSVWLHHEQCVLNRFLSDALESRIVSELGALTNSEPEKLSGVLRLAWCSRLLELNLETVRVEWPADGEIAAVLEGISQPAEAMQLGHWQMQLWLGLREMARVRKDRIHISAWVGEGWLAAMRSAVPPTERHRILNQWMIDWLDECRRSNWMLIPDDQPLDL